MPPLSSVATAPQPTPNAAPSAVTDEQPQVDNAATTGPGADMVGDIVVTARRRDERLQDVPVAVSAFSAAALERSTVQTVADIRTLTPGFTFASEGGKDNVALSLRGIGQIPLGEVTPGVVTYINNVALPSVGSNIPTYDVSSIQVLKGPQGTLFGRNTLGGAVLVSTQAPTYEFGGYVEGTYGRFDYRELEGAVNAPIIDGVAALRVAGQIRRQDPRTPALDNPNAPGFDDIHQDAFRVSLLLEPTDSIKSTTVYEYFKADELAGGLYLLRQNFPFGALGPGLGQFDPQVQGYLAQQQANRFGSFDDGINGGKAYRKSSSITNDTSFSFGDFTVRNIFGYRKNFSDQLINTGAVGPLTLTVPTGLPAPATVDLPFTLFHAAARLDRQYMTNELQFLGNFERFNFIVGAYYNNDKPDGPSGSQFTAFSVGGVPAPAITAHVRNKNYAVFGQVGFKLTDTLTLNAGGRYSWDKVSACGGLLPSGQYGTDGDCRSVASLGAADGVGVVRNRGEEPSWTLGLDYKPTDDLLLYAVTRRGYRGANVNTPVFETGATTGALTGCTPPTGGTGCPDLRPFQKTGEEKLTDIEIGTKIDYRAGDARGRLNIAAYRAKYKNALQFLNTQTIGLPNTTPDSPTNGSLGVNVADETIWGVEVEASISPVPSFTFSFNGAYTDVKVDKVELPGALPAGIFFTAAQVNRNSPTFSGTAAVSWTLPFHPAGSDVILNADLFMTDDFGGQNGEKLPGYNLVNARLDVKGIAGTGLDLGIFLRNALKEEYYSASSVLLSTFPISSVYVGEPRTWGVSARYRF